jgi:suppressor of ftsI
VSYTSLSRISPETCPADPQATTTTQRRPVRVLGQAIVADACCRRRAHRYCSAPWGVPRRSSRKPAGTTGEPVSQSYNRRGFAATGGVLRATIAAAPGEVRLGDFAFAGCLYNGSYLPPRLRARLGDIMRITFRNDLTADPSNLHFHGMAMSPQGNSDNVFVHVHPGHQFEYEVHIPAKSRQRPGSFWYPHAHGVVAKQMLGGMSGGLVVDGFGDLFPIVKGLPERSF